jgi:hypothetical protein
MMEWIKRLPLLFVPVFILVYLLRDKNQTEMSPSSTIVSRQVASASKLIIKKTKKTETRSEIKKLVILPKNQDSLLRDRTPQSLQSEYQHDPSIIVSKGNDFLTNVAAISKSSYTSKMGTIIHEANGLVFFKSEPDHNFIPVAQSRMTRALYPISSVLHIKGVNPSLRDDILGQGYSEHYYQPRIQFLSIRSDPSNIMKAYSDLRQKGYNVQLEVLTPHHKTFN